MKKTKKFTLIIILGLILATLVVPYLYNRWVHAPSHPAQVATP